MSHTFSVCNKARQNSSPGTNGFGLSILLTSRGKRTKSNETKNSKLLLSAINNSISNGQSQDKHLQVTVIILTERPHERCHDNHIVRHRNTPVWKCLISKLQVSSFRQAYDSSVK